MSDSRNSFFLDLMREAMARVKFKLVAQGRTLDGKKRKKTFSCQANDPLARRKLNEMAAEWKEAISKIHSEDL